MEQSALIIISYLFGSFPSGFIVAKLFSTKDIRKVGTKQIGAANVTRQLGIRHGALSLSLDVLKALIPMAILHYVLDQPYWVTAVCGCAMVFGHDFSLFLSFQGGEGLATTMAVLFFLSPSRFLAMLPFAILTLIFTGYVTVAGVVQLWGFAVVCWSTGVPMPVVYASLGLAVLALVKQTPWIMEFSPYDFMKPDFIAPNTKAVAAVETKTQE